MKVKLLGVRGTVPVHGEDFACYGGATSCVLVQAGDESIILDAGTGLNERDFRAWHRGERFSMLISHPHVDHLMGFPIFPPFFDSSLSCGVYLKSRDGLDAKAQIEKLMSPPLWPVMTWAFKAKVGFPDVESSFMLGDVRVDTMDVSHPGGCTAFRLSHGGKSLVYATDFEPAESEAEFEAFAKDCTLLLLDAQYSREEYERCRGFGHSYVERSISLARRCNAEKTVFIHHDPKRTDSRMEELERAIALCSSDIRFGREGEEICL